MEIPNDPLLEGMREELAEFDRARGAVLSMALHIEDTLDGIITSYFVRDNADRNSFLEIEVVNKMGFEKRVQLFEKICEEEKIDETTREEIIKAIKFVQEIRNKVAHWKPLIDPYKKEAFLRRRTKTNPIELFKLNKEMLDKLESERFKAIQGIVAIHHKFHGRLIESNKSGGE